MRFKWAQYLILLLLAGCQTAPKQESVSAIGAMAEGLTNTNISGADLKRLSVQVQKDPQAQSAVGAIHSAFDIQDTGVKYCPVDGKHFSSRLTTCPEHQVELKAVE